MSILKNPIYLGVNIDHVATVRQARGTTRYPDPVHAAILAELAGCDGITVHLREDRRHIQDRDVKILKEVIQTRLNFEMAATDFMIQFACELKPTFCCLVPEKRTEVTTEGGLDVLANFEHIKKTTDKLLEQAIQVSLFIDPVEAQIEASIKTGATIIELHTGQYALASTEEVRRDCLAQLQQAARFAHELGLQVNAGHGLHYQNVQDVAAIPEMVELNIGHAIVGQAIMVGFTEAVKSMKILMNQGRGLA